MVVGDALFGAAIALVSSTVGGVTVAAASAWFQHRAGNNAARRVAYEQLLAELAVLPADLSPALMIGMEQVRLVQQGHRDTRRAAAAARLYADRGLTKALDTLDESFRAFAGRARATDDDTAETFAAKVRTAWKEEVRPHIEPVREAMRRQLRL